MIYPRTLAAALAMAVGATVTTPQPALAGDVFMLGEQLYKTCLKEATFCQGYVSGVQMFCSAPRILSWLPRVS